MFQIGELNKSLKRNPWQPYMVIISDDPVLSLRPELMKFQYCKIYDWHEHFIVPPFSINFARP